jgi:hypothetical protein
MDALRIAERQRQSEGRRKHMAFPPVSWDTQEKKTCLEGGKNEKL